MYKQGAVEGAANTESGSRVFVYEVVGLRQNEETDQTNYQIRNSGSVFIRVPYNRKFVTVAVCSSECLTTA